MLTFKNEQSAVYKQVWFSNVNKSNLLTCLFAFEPVQSSTIHISNKFDH